ncbi:MAG: site-specific integrase [Chromatiales bacterium]|nr:site-specific integrase [Chromatiales bacterium]
MATITKVTRKTGTVYKARVRREGQPQVSKTFTNKSDALKWARAFEVDLERDHAGLIPEGQRHTLAEAVKKYRAEVLPELRPETAKKYSAHLDYWAAELGGPALSEIAPRMISKARDSLTQSGKSPATVNRYLATLASLLTAAVKRWHWLPDSPMRGVRKLTEANAGTRFLSESELSHLLAACGESSNPDLLPAVLLSVTTGARRGEIMGLRWKDLDLKAGVVRLRVDNETSTKGGIRSLPLVPQVLEILKERHEAAKEAKVRPLRAEDELVFPSKVSRHQPIDLRKPFESALRRAGIDHFRWHDMRHSAASFLAAHGASLLEIGEVLGHKNAATTKRYAHLVQQRTDDLVRVVAAKILGEKGEDR